MNREGAASLARKLGTYVLKSDADDVVVRRIAQAFEKEEALEGSGQASRIRTLEDADLQMLMEIGVLEGGPTPRAEQPAAQDKPLKSPEPGSFVKPQPAPWSPGKGTPKPTPTRSLGWAVQGAAAIKDSITADDSERIREYRPYVRLKNGESTWLRFLSMEPLAKIHVHYLHSLKRYFTCSEGMVDDTGRPVKCAFCEAKVPYSSRVLYEVVNRTPFTTKAGETKANMTEILEAGIPLHNNLESASTEVDLLKHDIRINRTGEQNASYSLFVKPDETSVMPDGAAPKRLADDWIQYYEPLPFERQRAILQESGATCTAAEGS